jgi:hypothetical protein
MVGTIKNCAADQQRCTRRVPLAAYNACDDALCQNQQVGKALGFRSRSLVADQVQVSGSVRAKLLDQVPQGRQILG